MKNFFAIWIILVSFVFGGICMKVIELVNQRHNIKSIFKMQERAVEMEEGGYSKTTGKFYLKSYKWSYILTGEVPVVHVDKDWIKTQDKLNNEEK